MKTVEMPKMGDTMEEGKILRWLKKEGEPVKRGEPLAEVETDKVNIEIEAFTSGVLRKILVPEGSSAPIGSSIALVGSADEPLPESVDGPGQVGSVAGTKPVGNKGVDEKSDLRPSVSPTAGSPSISTATSATAAPPSLHSTQTAAERGRIFISPVARRLAEEYHIDYAQLRGTGPNGRIIKLDIEAAITTQQQTAPTAPEALPISAAYTEPEPVATTEAGDVLEIPLTTMRRTIARRLTQSMQTAPHFYVTSVIDTGKLAQLRQQINAYAANAPTPVKVSFNDLIVKAVAQALLRMPEVNVSFAEDRILQKKQVHVGVAVALEQGLIVPVVHHADKLGILDLARETQRLAEAARTGKLRPEDLSGGTFTVSNLGMFDVDSFTAVINPPESAILAVGSITPTPVVEDGQVVVRDRMKVTLSSDHRAIDGAIAARFLQQLKRLLEEPFGLLL
ncbi:MAG TPA: dihydrolipoamide acetyltransferase family protein [Ktedonosporobacter sp.]|jgi:pyruvate dehydrogenase E2 component (dihydrolipoamide acetyltransferase)|nr:dihydrolipoamide acetyltransferase family protein [Ktedonosporobacter sp.]